MKHYHTCHICEALCGLEVEHDGEKVLSIRGDRDDVLSRGYLCPKGVAVQDLHEDPDRLRRPMRRDGDRWVEVSWEGAFAEIAERLHAIQKQHGRDAVGLYLGNPTAHHYDALLSAGLFRGLLGSRQNYSATSSDQLPHMLAALTMFGHQLLLPIPDVDRSQRMVILGGNPVVSNGSIMTAPGIKGRLKALKKRGGELIVLDPRRTETARLANEHHFIRPNSDALWLLAFLHTLFDEDLISEGPWREYCDHFDALEAAAQPFSPERVAASTGIDATTTRRLVRAHVAAQGAILYGRMGVSTQRFGGLCAWLLNVINIVTGNLDKKGGMMFTKPAVDIVELSARLGQSGHFDAWRSRVSGLPEFGGENPVSVLAEEIETPGVGQLRSLITVAGNPVLSAPNGARLAEAFAGLDLMVSIDPYITATSRLAHFILPPLSSLERGHYGIAFHTLAVHETTKYSSPLFEPSKDARSDWDILLELSAGLARARGGMERGLSYALDLLRRLRPDRVLDLMLRLGPHGALRGGKTRLTLRRLKKKPHGIDLGSLQPCFPQRLKTKNRRADLAPALFLGDLGRLEASMSASVEGLVLIGRRQLRSNNSWLHNAPRLMRGQPRCVLLIHPDDAATREITDGDRVALSSRAGRVEVTAALDDGMMPGVVSLPHGWGHAKKGARLSIANESGGESINDVTDDLFFDELTGNAAFSGVPVEVEGV